MAISLWFAAKVDPREWADCAHIEKGISIFTPPTWFYWEKPTLCS